MCPPTYFSVTYEINPWMNKTNQVNKNLAQREWERLINVYKNLGVEIETIEPKKGLPDMVFTANAGLVVDGKVILASFKYPERKPESAYFAGWFEQHGFEVMQLGKHEFFEGEGEALWFGGYLVAGWGFRTNPAGQARLKEIIGERLISVHLIDPRFYHLDTCFLPLDQTSAVLYSAAFDKDSQAKLKELVPNLLEVSHEDALAFACNSVVVGKSVLVPEGAIDLPTKLENLGYQVRLLDISEFKKSGGGIRCLTLTLEP